VTPSRLPDEERDAGDIPQPHRIRTPVPVTPSRRPDARDGESLASGPVPVPETQPRDAPGPAPTGRAVPVTEAEVPPFETERRTPPSTYHIPPPSVPGDRTPPPSAPRDQRYDDAADPERLARAREAEDRLRNAAQDAEENEDRREQNFREQEEERQRTFMENEQRRDEEAGQRRDEIWQDLEQRLAAPPQVVHAASGDAPPVAGSVRSASVVAPPQPADINEALRAQREELARERELERAERERLLADAEAERTLRNQEREDRIQALENELAAVKAELENERQLRATEEADAKEREQQETQERDEGIRNQLGDITNLIQDQADACARKKELMDQRWEESQARQEAQDAKCQEMFDMVAKMVEDRDADRVREEEERIANEGRPGMFPVCAFNE
jgi:hypothetical protein